MQDASRTAGINVGKKFSNVGTSDGKTKAIPPAKPLLFEFMYHVSLSYIFFHQVFLLKYSVLLLVPPTATSLLREFINLIYFISSSTSSQTFFFAAFTLISHLSPLCIFHWLWSTLQILPPTLKCQKIQTQRQHKLSTYLSLSAMPSPLPETWSKD